MKKLLTLFTLLLCVCSGAWGQYVYNEATSVPFFTVNFDDWASASDASTLTEATVHNPRLSYNSSKTKWENHSVSTDIAFDADGFYYIYNPGTARQLPTGDELSALTYVVAKAIGSSNYPKYGYSGSTVSKKNGEDFTTLNGLSVNSSNTADAVYEFHMPKQGYVRLLFGTDSSTEPSGGYNATLSGATTGSVAVNYLASDATYSVKTKSGVSFTTTTYTSAGKKMKSVEFAVNAGTTTITMNPALMAGNSSTNRKLMMYAVEVYVDDTPSTPTLTGAWKIGDDKVTSANVVQGGSATIPTFTVDATSGTPDADDYTVTYSLKDGSATNIFTFTESGGPTEISTANVGTATLVATLASVHTEEFEDADPNTFEYTVTVNAPAAPTFSPDASAVASGTAITMDSPDGGEIWYTTNGVDPTESNKTVYDAGAKPIITGATTIKAIARVNGYSSDVTTANYTVAVVGTKTWDFTDEVSAADLANLTADDTNWLAPSGSELRWKNNTAITANSIVKANSKTLQEFEGLVFSSNGNDIAKDNFRWMPGDGTGNGYLQLNGGNHKITIAGLKVNDVVTMTYEAAGGTSARKMTPDNATLTSGSGSDESTYNTDDIVSPTWKVTKAGSVVFTQDGGLKIYSISIQRAAVATDDVTVSSANYKAYNTTMATDFTMTDGVQAFIVSEATAETIKLEEIQMAPENTPVILKTAGDYTLYEAIVTPAAISGNKLQISNGTVSGDGSTKFALGKKNDVAGFYLVGNGVTIPTSYVEIIGGTAKDFIPFMNEGSETDGIKSVSTKVENGVRYNLAGQKVGADYKGIVIVNGKKYLRK